MPESKTIPIERVVSIILERVRRIESDAADVRQVLEKMLVKVQAKSESQAAPDTSAASEHKRARKAPEPGKYKPCAVREDCAPY